MADPRSTGDAQPAILVVDASKVTLVAARKLLEPNFGVYLAESGVAAWELVESIPDIAAVFTDQNLPGMCGITLLRQIRAAKDPRIADLPVIIITSGERNETSRREAFEAGATDFVLKPFDAVDLLTRARAWSSTSQRATTLRQTNTVLRELVTVDADTRAGNRDYFLQEAIKDRSFCNRHGSDHSLLYISIDNFERIQSEHGRAAAREAVAHAAEAIRSRCRREDTFGRVGDQAFALSLLQTSAVGARVLAERIRQAVSLKAFKPRGVVVPLTVSIGVTMLPAEPDLKAEQLLEAAERSARVAGRAGGNQVHVSAEAMAASNRPAPRAAPAAPSARPAAPTLPGSAAIAEDPEGFIEELLPLLQQLGDANRLALIDRLLVMTETPSDA